MSGGRWDYKQDKYRWNEEVDLNEVQQWLQVLGEVLHKIDYAECGDSSRKDAEPQIYDLLLEKADELWL